MANYQQLIELKVKGLEQLRKVEERVKNLTRLAAIDLGKSIVGIGGVKKEIDEASASFQRFGKIVRAIGVGGGLGALVSSVNMLSQAATALKFGGISKFAATLAAATGPAAALFKEVSGLAIQFPIVAGTVTVAGAALAAFAPQIMRAGDATLRFAKAAAETQQPIANLLASLASSGFRTDMFIDAAKAAEIYQKKLYELNETVANLSARQSKLQAALNRFNSESETAAKIAGKLVDVQRRLNEEQAKQNDLLRAARGLRPESEERKATNTYNVFQRRKKFLAEEAQAAYEAARAYDVLNNKRAEGVLETARQRRLAGRTQYGPGGAGPATASFEANAAAARQIQEQNAAFADQARKRIQWERKVDEISTSLQKQLNSLRTRRNAAIYRIEQRRIKKLADQQKKVDKEREDRLKQLADQQRKAAQKRADRQESLALGVGFPLLFGGGAGAVAGSFAGSFFGKGFGGQILGGAIGQQLDAAVQRAIALGNAVREIDLDTIKESGIAITGNLETQIELYKQIGNEVEAQRLVAEEVTRQTGVFAESQQDIANSGNRLGAAWGNFTAIISNTIGLLSVPFVAALELIFALVNNILRGLNFVVSAIGLGIKRAAEFVIELTLGEPALENINAWMAMFNDKLDESVLKARELFAQLNQRILSKDIELKFLRTQRTGNTVEDQIFNVQNERNRDLEQSALDRTNERLQVQKDLNKASKQDLEFALRQVDAIYDRDEALIRQRAANKIVAIQNREAEKSAKAQAQASKRSANELERSQKTGRALLVTYSNQIALLKAQTPLEKDLLKAKANYAANQQRINELVDEQQKAVLTGLNNDLFALQNAKAYTDELKRQNDEFFKRAGLQPRDQFREFSTPIDIGLAFGGSDIAGISQDERFTKAKEELEKLLDPINQVQTAAEGMSGAFTESFKGVIKGSMTAQEALANFFSRVADTFLDMAAQIITKMIVIKALESAIGIFGGGGGLFKGAGPVAFPSELDIGGFGGVLGFKAKGGPVMGGSPYVVGEKGPELFVPGRSGTIVPNSSMGGGSTNVVVNVDASGTNVGGDQQQAKQLGQAVAIAVQQELVKQKRPGGLLA